MTVQRLFDGKYYTRYRRKQDAYMRPWREGDDMDGVSISLLDEAGGSPKTGDMIAVNAENPADKWLVAAAYFAENFKESRP